MIRGAVQAKKSKTSLRESSSEFYHIQDENDFIFFVSSFLLVLLYLVFSVASVDDFENIRFFEEVMNNCE